jgi:GxxExxY protein
MTDEELSHAIIGAAIEVHRNLGPGLLERVYEEALCLELELRQIFARRQVEVPIIYKGRHLDGVYRVDLLVDDRIIVECKSTIEDHPVFKAQCLTHLRLIGRRIGLVINFGHTTLKEGIHRVINGFVD